MSLTTDTTTRPTTGEVFGYACAQIHQAAASMWPEAPVRLGAHVPSVTGYVHRMTVGDDRELFAKHSMLGSSLVSILRGVHGPWSVIESLQPDYAASAESLLAREAAQLKFLQGRLQAATTAGLTHGVLFTNPVTGPTLLERLLAQPASTSDLLGGVWAELEVLHRPGAPGDLLKGTFIGERSITGTFQRKFNGISGSVYIDHLGADRLSSETAENVVGVVRQVVNRLLRLRSLTLPSGPPSLAYGDLKPEHIHYPSGLGGRPTFLDPGLLVAGPVVDAAKLVSRTILGLIAVRPGRKTVQAMVDGVSTFTESITPPRAVTADLWLRELLMIWLMDTVNIMTTYLSAPATLPLPAQGLALIKAVGPVCAVTERMSWALSCGRSPRAVWDLALRQVIEAAS
ncbi:hypothetical protein M1P56_09715 [Streptomyces sp. HU2014]|uniref:hypothetical protein n=1 Tax=Streptomyces sp. HU2014 TaxID=2939414 RepID=UPI00200DE0A1|nr:hypothetical protein [Streptomyces sp. HU2014]UQI44602.1 hypothetical protein M1P56_09715 [Streptomyces sp. HU2014]